jgi:hypothetical protein
MRIVRLTGRVVVVALVFAALTLGAATLFAPVQAAGGGCICPHIYAPVKCSNGVTYTNGCYASCAHATDCVPVGPGPILL